MLNTLNFIFDRVVVINLDRRPDRLREFDKQAKANRIFYERFSAVDAVVEKIPPDQACILSHRKVLEKAIEDGVQRLFVFEDDAEFTEEFTTKFAEFYNKIKDDWDMLYLGAWIHNSKPYTDGVVKLKKSYSAHAYGINTHMMHKCLDATYNSWPIDISYSNLHKDINAYCAKPALVGQTPGFSDLLREYRDVRDKYL